MGVYGLQLLTSIDRVATFNSRVQTHVHKDESDLVRALFENKLSALKA